MNDSGLRNCPAITNSIRSEGKVTDYAKVVTILTNVPWELIIAILTMYATIWMGDSNAT